MKYDGIVELKDGEKIEAYNMEVIKSGVYFNEDGRLRAFIPYTSVRMITNLTTNSKSKQTDADTLSKFLLWLSTKKGYKFGASFVSLITEYLSQKDK